MKDRYINPRDYVILKETINDLVNADRYRKALSILVKIYYGLGEDHQAQPVERDKVIKLINKLLEDIAYSYVEWFTYR